MNEILLVAAKDLRIEARSKLMLTQALPFSLVTLVLFGLALDADRSALRSFTPGLFWVTVLFVAVMAVQRSVAVEVNANAFDQLRHAAARPAQIFAGKSLALTVQLIVVEFLLAIGVVVLYRASFDRPVLVFTAGVIATLAIAGAGSLYGVLSVGVGVKDSVLPMLVLPVLAPVLIAATRAFESGMGTAAVDGWSWVGILGALAAGYWSLGVVLYGIVLEGAR